MRRCMFGLLAGAVLIMSGVAYADEPAPAPTPSTGQQIAGRVLSAVADALILPYMMLAVVVPAGAGVDVDVHNGGRVRGLVGWPLQIPLDSHSDAWWLPLGSRHRLVVTPELTFGREQTPGGTFGVELRAGYRFVVHPGDARLGLLAGLGATATFAPDVRVPAISPEVGLHLGDAGDLGFATFIVRCDAFVDDDRAVRVSGQLGWTWF